MRTILIIALTANLFLSVWANSLEGAISGKIAAVSIGPISMLDSIAELPTMD